MTTLNDPRIGSLFTGTGALDMAARAIFGGHTAWYSDIKPAALALLAHHLPGVLNLGDFTHHFPVIGPITAEAAALEPIDILTGGWPCQPHSSAGKRLGEADPRALWPNVARVIAELRPRIFLGENVARVATNGELRRVVRSLAALGYVGTWRCVTAAGVGAPHKRDRCFVVAVRADVAADPLGLELRDESGRGGGQGGPGAGVARHDGAQGPAGVTLLPTPTQSMTTGAGTSGREGGLNLQTAVTLLPTPCRTDGQGGIRAVPERRTHDGTDHGPRLRDVAPTLDPARWGRYTAAIEQWERVLGRPAPDPTMTSPRTGGPQLAPAFVEWMMGLPAGWVSEVEGLAPKPAGLRNARLSLLGDGVVRQQAEVAYRECLAELFASADVAA